MLCAMRRRRVVDGSGCARGGCKCGIEADPWWGSCCVEPWTRRWLFLRAIQGTLRRIIHPPSSTLSLRRWVDN